MIFDNVQRFRFAVAKYIVMKGLGVNFIKNEGKKFRAKCKDKYLWVLFASYENNCDTLIIKTYKHKHNCTRVNKNMMATSNFMIVLLKKKIMS